MANARSTMPVGVRLLHVVDDYLRKKQRGKGDMSKLISEALGMVKLDSVPLLTIHGKKQPVVAKVTQVVIRKETRHEISRLSKIRGCSMNELLNSALVASLLKSRSAHEAELAPPAHTVALNRMTPERRERFFATLLSLRGHEAVPSLRSAVGGYYEYEPELGATVENAQDGRRFLVDSASGGELVRIREVGQSPFVEKLPGTLEPRRLKRKTTRRK